MLFHVQLKSLSPKRQTIAVLINPLPKIDYAEQITKRLDFV